MSEEKGGAPAVPVAPAQEAPVLNVKKEAERVAEPITGLTSKQLSAGYWWISHKLLIRKLALSLLLALDAVLVLYSLYAWGTYAFYGYWKERTMLRDMTVSHIPFKKYREAHAPQTLVKESVLVFDSGTKAGWKDIVLPVSNPNERWIATLSYQFQDGEEITPEKTAVILPGESAYIGILGYAASTTIRDPQFIEKNVAWERADMPDPATYMSGRLDFEVGTTTIKSPGTVKDLNVYQISFPFTNHTSFSYWSVPLSVLLYSGDQLSGVEQVSVEPFASGETQAVALNVLPDARSISRVEVKPRLNVFDKSVFKPIE